LYHQVFGPNVPIGDEPIILLFKLGKDGRPLPDRGEVQYAPTPNSTDPITSQLTETQLQTWLHNHGVPDPDNTDTLVADLELARIQHSEEVPQKNPNLP
jgi:hypothetical protein